MNENAILIDFPFLSGTCPEQGGRGFGGRSFQNFFIIPEPEGREGVLRLIITSSRITTKKEKPKIRGGGGDCKLGSKIINR